MGSRLGDLIAWHCRGILELLAYGSAQTIPICFRSLRKETIELDFCSKCSHMKSIEST